MTDVTSHISHSIPADLAALLAPGILSDAQIRHLAETEEMITPFVAESVRDGGVISYGLSSYGYDSRIGRNFKVFSNANAGTIIDPKNFDPSVYVDFKDVDECIIPPNGFVLGHTAEYFKIPEDVLVVCLGKSTYARCFSADTAIALNDGTTPLMSEVWQRIASGETLYAVAFDDDGNVVNPQIRNIRLVGTEPVRALTFSDGSVVKSTGDHLFWSLDDDGTTVNKTSAEDLKPDVGFKQFSYNRPNWDLTLDSSVPLVDPVDVYCFETDNGNFMLGNGVAVDNCGAIVNVTPLEPGWEGEVTIEISNTTSLPLRVHADEGICQFLFFRGSQRCLQSYRDKIGKYMGQRGVTTPRVERDNPTLVMPTSVAPSLEHIVMRTSNGDHAPQIISRHTETVSPTHPVGATTAL